MPLTEPCDRHEMIGCQVCNPRPMPALEPDSRPFAARYDGQCPECDLPIVAGVHRIILSHRGGYRHAIHEGCR